MNLFVIFLTGLTTGGLSCLAMQGGLLASVIANQKEQELEGDQQEIKDTNRKQRRKLARQLAADRQLSNLDQLDWMPVGMFLVSKLVAHTILGFMLGALGSVISLSLGVRLTFQFFTALFMFGTAMNLMNVHPIFRFLAFQPPKFVQRMVRKSSKSQALFAPALLGVMTIFIPCGVTQAMEVLAINTANPWYGAAIMFAFVLGTSPLFAFLGVATAKLSEAWHKSFTTVAAYTLVFMALYSLNGVMVVLNSPVTFGSLTEPIRSVFSTEQVGNSAMVENGVQKVTINVLNNGYSPNYLRVQKGIPVELTLRSNETYSCALAFIMPDFNINTFLKATDSKVLTFTPAKAGKYRYTCSMGMYTGVLEVI